MRTTLSFSLLSLLLLAGTASPTLADIPSALDRVPIDTPLVVAMDKVSAAKESVLRVSRLLDGPKMEGEEGLFEPLNKLLALPGLSPDGSAAVLMYPKTPEHRDASGHDATKDAAKNENKDENKDEFFDEDTSTTTPADSGTDLLDQFDVIALVPVLSAREFATGLGATLESGKGSCEVEGHKLFLRDIGSGQVAMSPTQSALDAFKPGEKQLAAHTSAIGEVGNEIAKSDHMLIIANVPLVKDKVEALMKDVGAGAEEEMGMPGMSQILPMGESMLEGFTQDASRMIFGAGVGDSGLLMDVGTQYKEGSPAAAMMDAQGNTRDLLTKLPGKSFILAGAFDVSSPGAKKIMSSFLGSAGAAAEKAQNHGQEKGEEKAFQSPFSMIAQLPSFADGWGVVIGENPAGMQTGFLSQSVYYVQTKDPAAYLAKMEEWNAATNGLKAEGVTYKSQYAKATEEVAGVKVDSWEVQTITDKNNPNAMMLNMTQQALFGGSRMRGYAASAGQGVVMTMSRNKANLTAAIAAATGNTEDKSAHPLGADKDIQHAASFLPEHSAAAIFVNPKPLFQMASDLMDQIGGPVFDVPEKTSPVALGAAMHAGGMHTRVFVPGDVLTAVEKITKSMEEAQAEIMAPANSKKDDGAPRF